MSAPYRTSLQAPPYNDITPFAHALVEAVPDRLVWGSDWPHVLLETTMPNDGDLVDQIAVWVPDESGAQAHPRRQCGEALRLRAVLVVLTGVIPGQRSACSRASLTREGA